MDIPDKDLLAPGHRGCAGCGASIAVKLALNALGKNTVAISATGCLEVMTTPYPETSWEVPFIHVAFENSGSVASGVESALRIQGKDDVNVVAFGVDGALVEVSGALNADMFKNSGIDTIPDGALLMTLSAPEVLCWTNAEELPTLTATVQGIPTGYHEIISNDIPVGDISISGIATIEADASENATFLLSFDGGAWMIYTNGKWSASDVGMTTAELIAVPSNAWNSMIASANTMRLKAVLDGVDTVTEVKFNFNNDAKVRTWDYLKSWTWQNVKSRTWGSFKGA